MSKDKAGAAPPPISVLDREEQRERRRVMLSNRLDDFNVPATGVGLHARNLVLFLWAKNKARRSCPGVHVPEMVMVHSGTPKEWLYTDKRGNLQRRDPSLIERRDIYDKLCARSTKSANTKQDAIKAVHIVEDKWTKQETDMGGQLRHLDNEHLEDLLGITFERPSSKIEADGLLIGFLPQLADKSELIHAHWSGGFVKVFKTASPLKLCTEWSEPPLPSLVSAVETTHTVDKVKKLCARIYAHVYEVSPQGYRICHMKLHFKMDASGKLWFLWCSHLRLMRGQYSTEEYNESLPGIQDAPGLDYVERQFKKLMRSTGHSMNALPKTSHMTWNNPLPTSHAELAALEMERSFKSLNSSGKKKKKAAPAQPLRQSMSRVSTHSIASSSRMDRSENGSPRSPYSPRNMNKEALQGHRNLVAMYYAEGGESVNVNNPNLKLSAPSGGVSEEDLARTKGYRALGDRKPEPAARSTGPIAQDSAENTAAEEPEHPVEEGPVPPEQQEPAPGDAAEVEVDTAAGDEEALDASTQRSLNARHVRTASPEAKGPFVRGQPFMKIFRPAQNPEVTLAKARVVMHAVPSMSLHHTYTNHAYAVPRIFTSMEVCEPLPPPRPQLNKKIFHTPPFWLYNRWAPPANHQGLPPSAGIPLGPRKAPPTMPVVDSRRLRGRILAGEQIPTAFLRELVKEEANEGNKL